MTLTERSNLYASSDFQKNVKTAMLDKIAYWSSSIPTEEQSDAQEQQAKFSMFALADQDHYAQKIAGLAIADVVITNAVEATDANIIQAVNNVLSGNLAFLI